MSHFNVSVILPIFNEGQILEESVTVTLSKLSCFCDKVELIAVDDGSSDQSLTILKKLKQQDGRIKIVHHQINRGYGAALRSGIRKASQSWILFVDADLQFDVNDLRKFIDKASSNDFVVGYRLNRADAERRIIISRVYNFVNRILFSLRLKDVDCAFKLMRLSVLKKIKFHSDSFFVSVELMALADKLSCRITQVGVKHYPRTKGFSTVSPRRILATVSELLQFKFKASIK